MFTQTITAAGVAGAIAPLLTALLNQSRWSSQVKQLVALAVALLIGVVVLLMTGGLSEFSWAGIAAALGTVYAFSQGAYAILWKPSGAAKVIEAKTSIVQGEARPAEALEEIDDAGDEPVVDAEALLLENTDNAGPDDPEVVPPVVESVDEPVEVSLPEDDGAGKHRAL